MFSYFIKLYASVQYWKMDEKDIADTSKLVKEFIHYFLVWGGLSGCFQQDHIYLGLNELDEKSLWGSKLVGKLLSIVTVAHLQQLDLKKKPVIYIRGFVKIYNWRFRRLVHETHGMVKLEKYLISKTENPLNLGNQRFYKISEVL